MGQGVWRRCTGGRLAQTLRGMPRRGKKDGQCSGPQAALPGSPKGLVPALGPLAAPPLQPLQLSLVPAFSEQGWRGHRDPN